MCSKIKQGKNIPVPMLMSNKRVDLGGPVAILATGSEVRGFNPGRSRWIFSER